jgi:hypothetical protein
MKTRTARQIVSGNVVQFKGKISKVKYEELQKKQVGRAHNILRERRKIERQNKRGNHKSRSHKSHGGRTYSRPNYRDRVKTTNGQSKQNKART